MRWVSLADVYLLAVLALVSAVGWSSSPRLREAAALGAAGAAFRLSRRKRRRCEANLARAFVEMSAAERQAIARDSFVAFWREAFALGSLRNAGAERAEVNGLERVAAARREGKGVLLVESSFFGQRTLAKQILHRHGIEVHQVHAERHLAGFQGGPDTLAARRVLRPYFHHREQPFLAGTVWLPASASLAYARQLLDTLKRNEVVCVSGDGHTGQKHVVLPFLGRTRGFTTGVVSLARLSGAALLPMFCVRQAGGTACLTIEPALQLRAGPAREHNLEEGMALYARLLEQFIRRFPGQYLGWHIAEGGA
jgi:KDO2-lipid IV(A) lauroyltransferase